MLGFTTGFTGAHKRFSGLLYEEALGRLKVFLAHAVRAVVLSTGFHDGFCRVSPAYLIYEVFQGVLQVFLPTMFVLLRSVPIVLAVCVCPLVIVALPNSLPTW